MLSSCNLVAFIATTDLPRATAFYAETLGLDLLGEDGFASVFRVGSTELRLTAVNAFTPAPYTALGWSVWDLQAEIAELSARGVTFERFEGIQQDDLGVWTAPGGTGVAWFKDPDQNVLSLTQPASATP